MTQDTEIQLAKAPELVGVEASKAAQIEAVFKPMVGMLYKFEESYNGILAESEKEITPNLSAKAKRLRLDIAKVRTTADKARIEEKKEFLRAGQAIDGVYKIFRYAVESKETKLKDIELHVERIATERLATLEAERCGELSKYYDTSTISDLGGMPPEVWDAFLSTQKKMHEDKLKAEAEVARAQAEKVKADAEEAKRIRIENENLKIEALKQQEKALAESKERDKIAKAEAKERQRLAKIESDKAAKLQEKIKAEAKIRLDKEIKRLEAERVEAARIKKISEDKLAKERAEVARVMAELKAKEDFEAAEIKRTKEAEEAKLNQGDEGNMISLHDDLMSLIGKYEFKSIKNKELSSTVYLKIAEIALLINGKKG